MTLKYKLALGSILLTGGGILAISQFSYHFIERARYSELESRGILLARHFADQYGEAVQRRDETELLKGMMRLLNDPEVFDGMVLELDGKVIAHTDIQEVGNVRGDWTEQLARSGKDSVVQVSGAAQKARMDILVLAKPPKKAPSAEAFFMEPNAGEELPGPGRAAIVRIGLKMQPTLDFVSRIRRGIMLIAAVTLTVTLAMSVVFAAFITRPLGRLMNAIMELGSGNTEYRVEAGPADEIGKLGIAFNAMTKQLCESQEKALRSEKLAAVGRLASGVGHDLRNPLAAIKNTVYYLRDSVKGSSLAEQDPTVMEFLELADREIQNMASIISDLMDFSRIPKLAPQPTDINPLLVEAKGLVEIPRNIRVVENYSQDLPQLMLDRGKMRQVFINLIQNAVQAMPGGGELRLASRLEDAGSHSQRTLLVDFEDTGCGISGENLKNIFEPLFTTKAKGTGLGLAICLGLVEAHKGRILVVSREGNGSTFTVRLSVEKC